LSETALQSLIEAGGTIVAALVGAVAAVVTWYLATQGEKRREREERQRLREQEALAREQRVIDIVTAVHAEICASLRGLDLQTQPDEQAYFIDNENPFVVADDTDFVFASIAGDLTILPEAVIHEIVAYYKVARQTNLLTQAIERPLFQGQSREEQQKYVRELLELTRIQARLASDALDKLEQFRPALREKWLSMAAETDIRRLE
jgi:type II secretory pathway pseudopilin PulG